MCGRYTLTSDQRAALGLRFGAELPGSGGLERFNVAPTEPILAVTTTREPLERRARLLRWGLIPFWSRDLKAGARMINCRAETALEKRAFSPLVAESRSRCLIVADGFYEWLRSEDRKRSPQPFRFTVDGGAPFAFAGLWTRATIDGERVESATIMTTAPNEPIARLHDRMPVILPDAAAEAAWLSPDLGGEEAVGLCRPLDGSRMAGAPANPAVNRPDPDHEGPHLLVAPAAA